MATTRDITYEADGRTMIGTLALPDGADQRPGVLVCHEGPGLDDHARARAARLADELGYVAFALDYHGDGKPIADRDQMMARIGELRSDPPRAFAVGTAGLDILRAEPRTDTGRLAAIGFCFGGTLSLELARGGADLKAVVGFHSGPLHRAPRGRPQHHRQGAGPHRRRRPHRRHATSGGPSRRRCGPAASTGSSTSTAAPCTPSPTRWPRRTSFPGIAYDEATDRRSWQAMVDLFAEVF